MKQLNDFLQTWGKQTDSFGKLQAGYAVFAISIFLLAGIVGLIQYNLGQTLLFFALVLTLTFIANGVMFAVIRTFIVPMVERPAAKPRKK